MEVLVGYATARGSTREIAEHLAARLERHGLDTEVSDLARVAAPERFDAYVLGSAVHDRRWLPEARAFLAEHARELAGPVWVFSVGMPDALRWPLRLLAGRQAQALVADFAGRLAIRDHLAVSGVIRDEDLGRVGRLLMLLTSRGAGDYRDWARIDAWADRVARDLVPRPGVAPAPDRDGGP